MPPTDKPEHCETNEAANVQAAVGFIESIANKFAKSPEADPKDPSTLPSGDILRASIISDRYSEPANTFHVESPCYFVIAVRQMLSDKKGIILKHPLTGRRVRIWTEPAPEEGPAEEDKTKAAAEKGVVNKARGKIVAV